jgi:Putative prokaryotic signal transducing protein
MRRPWRRRRRPRPEPVRWVQVAFARHQPEAEMLAAMLAELEIPCLVQRAVDVPDMLAGGPRRLLVPADRELEARALLDPFAPIPPEQDV